LNRKAVRPCLSAQRKKSGAVLGAGQFVIPMQSIHDSPPHVSYEVERALAGRLIPESGASFTTIAGEATAVAQVFLAPGDGLSRRHRRLAQAHPLVSCNIRADWSRPPSPDAFHQDTLRWAAENATDVALWSAPYPEFADEVAEWGILAAERGSRFVLIVETTIEKVAEWARFVRRCMQHSVDIKFFGPERAEAQI
jgi:hypothetical protein